jgi:hypothetical protein
MMKTRVLCISIGSKVAELNWRLKKAAGGVLKNREASATREASFVKREALESGTRDVSRFTNDASWVSKASPAGVDSDGVY